MEMISIDYSCTDDFRDYHDYLDEMKSKDGIYYLTVKMNQLKRPP